MEYVDLKIASLKVTKEPLAGDNFTNLLRLLVQNKFKISPCYFPRVIYSIFLSSLMSPFRLSERIKFDKSIENVKINDPPIFLLGHWRSGTTYLHNLFSMDNRFGFFSTFYAYLPGAFLGYEKLLKPIVVSSIPDKRPMDDVKMDADFPQEDEYALGAFTPFSYYHGWSFPKNMDFYNRFVCFNKVPKEYIEEWKKVYLYLIKKVILNENDKRIVIKNPSNTGRIKLLLEMFPDAKFVHIHRNPYHVFLSMMRFMRIVIPLYCVQNPPKIDIIENSMMNLYEEIYKNYFKDRDLIPKGNFVEVKYEDFVINPLSELKKIYKSVNIDGFDKYERTFNAYILSQSEVKLNSYHLDEELKDKIYRRWGFVFKEYGYDR
jgi:hypothetical protein